MEILYSKVSLIIFNLIINHQNPYKIEKIYVWNQTLFSKCPNFFDRQVGQSKFIFVHTRVLGQVGQTQFGYMSKILQFFFGTLSVLKPQEKAPPQKKLRNFGQMSKTGLPYLPSTLVWTKKSLDKYPLVYPTYLSKKFGHFGIKSCQSFLPYFLRFLTRIFFRSLSISVRREIL